MRKNEGKVACCNSNGSCQRGNMLRLYLIVTLVAACCSKLLRLCWTRGAQSAEVEGGGRVSAQGFD